MAGIVVAGLGAAASAALPIAISGGVGALFTTSALSTVLTSFAGGALSAAFAQSQRGGGGGGVMEPSLLVRQPVLYGSFVYGRCRVQRSGVTFAENDGNDLWLVVPIACHEINAVLALYDGEDLMWSAGGGYEDDYDGGKLAVHTRLGTDDQTHVADLVAAISDLDSNFRGRGIAYVALKLRDFNSDWSNQLPQLWIEVEGAKPHDPRTASTAFTANAALCINHYLTATRGGPGETRVNEATLIASANLCDEWVADDGALDGTGFAVWDRMESGGVTFHRRYEINGSLSSQGEPAEVLREMALYMAGHLIWSQGEFHIKAGAYSAPVASYTEADLLGAPSVTGNVRIEEQVHGARGRFSDPSANYQITDFPEVAFDVTVPATEAPNYHDVDLGREIHPERAARLAVLSARQFFRASALMLPLPIAAAGHAAGDRVDFRFDAIGIDAPWEVQEVRLDLNPENPAVRIYGIEDDPSFWSWSSDTATIPPISPTSALPRFNRCLPVPSITVQSVSYQAPDGITHGALEVTWPASPDFYVTDYLVRWSVGGEIVGSAYTGGALRHVITGVSPTDSVTVEVIAQNGRGVQATDNPSETLVVGPDVTAPPVPTGWTGEPGVSQITLTGPASAASDFKAFRVYGATAADPTPVHLDTVSTTRYVRELPTGDPYTRYKVSAVDHSGNESGLSDFIEVVPRELGQSDVGQDVWDAIASDATDIANQLIGNFDTATVQPIAAVQGDVLDALVGPAGDIAAVATPIATVQAELVAAVVGVGGDIGSVATPVIDDIARIDTTIAARTAAQLGAEVDIDRVAENLTSLWTRVSEAETRMSDAGIYVDPETGTVRLAAYDYTDDRISDVEVRVSSAESAINLRATTTYVDSTVAEAALDPTGFADFTDLQARMQEAELDIDGLESSITAKASVTTVDEIDIRLDAAEVDIDGLQSSITLKASAQDLTDVESRVTTAEQELDALDGASIRQAVIDTREAFDRIDDSALTSLSALIDQYRDREALRTEIAYVQTEITARVTEESEASASARTSLGAQIAGNTALIETEQQVRADGDSALASDISTLQVETGDNAAAIIQINTVSAGSGSAAAQALYQLQQDVNGAGGTVENIAAIDSRVEDTEDGLVAAGGQRTEIRAKLLRNVDELAIENLQNVLRTEEGRRQTRDGIADARSEVTALVEENRLAEAAARLQLSAAIDGNAALISQETVARADGDSALAADITTLQSDLSTLDGTVSGNVTAIGSLQTTQSTQQGEINQAAADITTLQSDLSTLDGTVSGNVTAIGSLQTTQSTQQGEINQAAADITTLQSDLSTLDGTVSGNVTAIGSLQTTQSTQQGEINQAAADITTLQSDLSTLDGTVSGNVTAIGSLQTTQSTQQGEINQAAADITTLQSDLSTLDGTVSGNVTAIGSLQTTQSTQQGEINQAAADITTLQSDLSTLDGTVSGNVTAIGSLQTTQSTQQGEINQAAADITTLQSDLSTLDGTVSGNVTAIGSLQTTQSTQQGEINQAAADITTLQSDLSTLDGTVSGNVLAISSLQITQSAHGGNITANADAITALTTTVGSNTTTISEVQSSIDGIKGTYAVSINANGHVSGFGLTSELLPGGGGATSAFIVQADKFAVVAPDGTNSSVPFEVVTSTTVIDGVSVPAGVYMTGATIANLSSRVARIGTLKSADTGERVEISDDVIKVFDSAGQVRVQIGDLAA